MLPRAVVAHAARVHAAGLHAARAPDMERSRKEPLDSDGAISRRDGRACV